jgi:pyridinium-3,5-bisthiocarboxylic acid mononucleotide nickel chelatase
MKIAYLDGSSGISGDMFLAALLDAGIAPKRMLEQLKKISVGFYEFKRTVAMRRGLAASRVEIRDPGGHQHRHLAQIEKMISESTLSATVKERALKIFRKLGEVEAKLHNQPIEKVHFHEVGALDTILDVVGACVGIELLEIDQLISSPLNVGGGSVEAAHGTLPVPAPATAELLKEIPIYSSGVEGELVTPTGAAIVSTLATSFGPLPAMKVSAIGYGAGEKDFPSLPNIVRLLVGEKIEVEQGRTAFDAGEDEIVSVIEANVDDMSPQVYGFFAEQALAAGALDVTCASIQMKKNRPAMMITVLTEPERSDDLARLVFEQTTTIGLRIYQARRKVLMRQIVTVDSAYGPVNVKVAWLDGKVVNVAPEYDDCKRVAEERGVPLKQVMIAAQAASLLGASAATGGTYDNPAPVSDVPEFVQSADAPESSNLTPEPASSETEVADPATAAPETESAASEAAPASETGSATEQAAPESDAESAAAPAAESQDSEDLAAPAKTGEE